MIKKRSKNWQNIINYINAVRDQMDDAETRERQNELSEERYNWLNNTYRVSKKPIRISIFKSKH